MRARGNGWPVVASVDEQSAALAELPDPVFILRSVRDADGNVVELTYAFLNKAAARLYGQPAEAVLGRGQIELFPSVRERGIWDTYMGVLESGSPASFDVPSFDENGVQGSFRLTVSRLGDGVLVIANDTTELAANEARLRAIVDSLLDPHVQFGPILDQAGQVIDFIYTDANPAACEYDNKSYDELVGSRLLELLPGQSASGLLKLYADVMDTGDPLMLDDYPYDAELFEGERRWYDIRAAKMNGGLTYTWRDVTERHLAVEHDRRMAAIVEQAGDAIIGMRLPEEVIDFWNPAAEKLYGYSPEEIIGQSAFVLSEPDPSASAFVQQVIDQLVAGDGPIPVFESVRFRKDGTPVMVEISVTALKDGTGQTTGVVTFHRDITQRVKIEKDLAEQRDREKQRLDELEKFTHMAVGRELKMIELKNEIEFLKQHRQPRGGNDYD